eukprot:11682759-Alexandrium_andersonii.AAC.1
MALLGPGLQHCPRRGVSARRPRLALEENAGEASGGRDALSSSARRPGRDVDRDPARHPLRLLGPLEQTTVAMTAAAM